MKKCLLGGVSALAFIATPALANDVVNWRWDKTVTTNIEENIIFDAETTWVFDLEGLIEIEKLQIFAGSLIAETNVNMISFDIPGGGNGEGPSGVVMITIEEGDEGDFIPLQEVDFGDTGLSGSLDAVNISDCGDGPDVCAFDDMGDPSTDSLIEIELSVEGTVDGGGVLDLDDLPYIDAAATAVANLQSVQAGEATHFHEGQFVYGSLDGPGDLVIGESIGALLVASLGGGLAPDDISNTNLAAAASLVLADLAGFASPATISATTNVNNINNAQINAPATAIANSMSIALEVASANDAYSHGDFTQMAYANVSATANVDNISYSGFNDLGTLEAPVINATATAIGNAFNLTLNLPEAP